MTSMPKVDEMARVDARIQETISELANAAKRTSSMSGMIKAVADQTNLLSLNGIIEAARAGETGKGFSVVASEVTGLANLTEKSANEISDLVAGMQEQTLAAVSSMQHMARLAKDAQSATRIISNATREQQDAASEIAHSISHTSQGSSELAENVEHTSTAIRETAGEADRAMAGSVELATSAEQLRDAVDDFLAKFQAA